MDYYNRLYIMLFIFGVLISSQYGAPKEINKAKGDGKIDERKMYPPQQNERVVIRDNLRGLGTMSSVKQYMAINHVYRYRHTYDASDVLDGVMMIVQDSGEAIGQTFKNMTASVTSAAAPMFYHVSEIMNSILVSMVKDISDGMVLIKDGLDFAADTTKINAEKFTGMAHETNIYIAERVLQIPTAITSTFTDCMVLIEEDMNLVQGMAKMGAERFTGITFDAFAYAHKMSHSYKEILQIDQIMEVFCQKATHTMESLTASGMMDVAVILLTVVLGTAMVLYVAHKLDSDSHCYEKEVFPDNDQSKELLQMLRIGDMNQRKLVDLVKGISALKNGTRKLEGQMAQMKQVAEERQVAVMDRLDEGSALLKKMQEMDNEFCLLNGYE